MPLLTALIRSVKRYINKEYYYHYYYCLNLVSGCEFTDETSLLMCRDLDVLTEDDVPPEPSDTNTCTCLCVPAKTLIIKDNIIGIFPFFLSRFPPDLFLFI